MNRRNFGRMYAGTLALICALICGVAGPSSGAEEPKIGDKPRVPQTQPVRSMDEIGLEFAAVSETVGRLMPGLRVPTDPMRRAEVASKVLPEMRKMSALFGEMALATPQFNRFARQDRQALTALMALLGEGEAVTDLKKMALSTDLEDAAGAKAWLAGVNWEKAQGQPAAQEKLADDFLVMSRGHRTSEVMVQVASLMIDKAATPTLAERIEQIVTNELTSPAAKELAAGVQRFRKVRALVNQPLIVTGTTPDNKPFNSGDWKGRVVLVNFWATWCPPALTDMPRLKKLYADYHDKGLEIVGVTSDRDLPNFNAWVTDNKDVPWPQLFDPKVDQVHPLVKQYGIEALPTTFLIDRRGIVRSVTAYDDAEVVLPKLLAEPAK